MAGVGVLVVLMKIHHVKLLMSHKLLVIIVHLVTTFHCMRQEYPGGDSFNTSFNSHANKAILV